MAVIPRGKIFLGDFFLALSSRGAKGQACQEGHEGPEGSGKCGFYCSMPALLQASCECRDALML